MTDETVAPIGHNMPPADALTKAAEVIAAAGRLPASIPLDDTTGLLDKAADYVRITRGTWTAVDSERKVEKQPHDDAAKAVQLKYTPVLDQLTAAKAKAERLINDHNRAKQAAAQKLAAEAAARARTEADARMANAAALETDGHTNVAATVHQGAMESEKMASNLERMASAPIQDVVRTQTAGGTVSGREVWTFELTDNDALRATLGPLGDYFTAAHLEAAVRGWLAAAKKAGRISSAKPPTLPGVTFVADTRAVVR